MVNVLHNKRGETKGERALRPSFGKQLLEIITAGMYSDPCMILREYVQNSVDSIDVALSNGLVSMNQTRIDIKLDGHNRNLIVFDNGVGVKNTELESKLGSLGLSKKEGKGLRGFRGIGRLGGLTYCDELVFETRAKGDSKIGIVHWNGKSLRSAANTHGVTGLVEIIRKIATVSYRKATPKDPKHFFKVTMCNINKFHADRLTSIDVINQYLLRVAPLPYNPKKFSFANQIHQYLSDVPGYCVHNIYLNDNQLFSPYQDEILVNKQKGDRILSVDFVEFKNANGSVFGKGWIGRTNFLGVLPKSEIMRGITMRQGNIEVGDEDYLEDYFTEKRFATWHIGAFHFNYSLKPNARRDGFEETENYERFLEIMSVLGKQMSKVCRSTSVARYSKQDLDRSLGMIDRFIKGGVFVDQEHYQKTLEKVSALLDDLESRSSEKYSYLKPRLNRIRKHLSQKNSKHRFITDLIDQRQLRRVNQAKLLELTCSSIMKHIKNDGLSMKIVADVLTPYFKQKKNRKMLSMIS